MTQDEIIRMAREADIEVAHMNKPMTDAEVKQAWIERFAALVAAHEREACAKVCRNQLLPNPTTDLFDAGFNRGIGKCAAAIRARGEK